MTWGELLKQGQERLKKAGIQEYELDAWYLFEQAFSMSRARYFLDAKEEAAPEAPALKAYENGLERRSGRVPLHPGHTGIHGHGVFCQCPCADPQAGY